MKNETIQIATFLKEDGTLNIKSWATAAGSDSGKQLLAVSLAERPSKMAHSSATGEGLVSNGFLGADMIRLKAGQGFVPHTHPGDHLLVVVGGEGTITYNGSIYPTHAGQILMIDGQVPHAVGAITDHVILAVGAPHRPVDAEDRMKPVEYQEVTANIDELHCLICDLQSKLPDKLHEAGCPHCPCYDCVH